MDERAKQAQELHSWLTGRMRFQPKGKHSGSKIPRPEDFKYLCRGPMIDIWQYVTEHVHSAEVVKKVKGNLALGKTAPSGYKVSYKSSKTFDDERERLLEQRRRLRSELSVASSAVTDVKADLQRTREAIAAKEQEYQLAVTRIRDVERKKSLLDSASRHNSDEIAKLDEYHSQLCQRVDQFQNMKKQNHDPLPLLSKQIQTSQSTELGLESSCTREVRETCALIREFLNCALQGSFDKDEGELDRSRSGLWQEVSKVLRSYTSAQLMDALCENTQNSVQLLTEKTSAIDIRRDAEELRFKYESGGQLSDISCPPTILHTVRQLLEENQQATFARFLETEKSLNNTWRLKQRLVELSDVTDKLLVRNHHSNPGALELARSVFQTELSIVTSKAVLKLLERISDGLKEDVGLMLREKQIVYEKYQKIQDFKRLADGKQDLIRVLIKQNMDSRLRLQKDQLELLKYTERMSGSENSDMSPLTLQLRDGISREVEAFVRLQVPQLLLTTLSNGDRVAVINLSINKLNGSPDIPGGQTVQKLIKTLKFHEFRASECFLPHVASLLMEVMDADLHLKFIDRKSKSEGESRLQLKMKGLCSDVQKSDGELVDRLLPSLQKRLADATQSLATCLQVKDVALCWWEQPAQTCTPWITVDGMNLRQWRDKWIVAATQLRHMSRSSR